MEPSLSSSAAPSPKTPSPGARLFFSRIFPWPFILIGVIVLFFGLRGLIRAKESLSWPTVPGTVEKSNVEYQRGDKGGGTYHAVIRYVYTVGGVKHSGDRVAYGDYGSSDSSHAQGVVDEYPKGKAVKVYYLPENPGECLLEPGVKAQSWFLPGFGLVFFAAGMLMAFFLPKLMAKAEQSGRATGEDKASVP